MEEGEGLFFGSCRKSEFNFRLDSTCILVAFIKVATGQGSQRIQEKVREGRIHLQGNYK